MPSHLTSSRPPMLDRIPFQERLDILTKNLARIDVPGMSPERLAHWQTCAKEVAHSEEIRSSHEKLIAPLLAKLSAQNMAPIILEGVDPPWMLKSLIDAPPPKGSLGFRQRVLVVQSDWNEFFDGLACVDLGDGLGDGLGDPRFVWFVGQDASDRLIEWVDARLDDAPPAMAVQCPAVRKKTSPDAPGLIREIDARWMRHAQELKAKVAGRRLRDRQWWANRFEHIGHIERSGPASDPLRVLIPVSRYTTYLKHAAADLEASFIASGCQCRVLMETDDSTIMSENSIMRAIDEVDPDLIVSINYTRSALGADIPQDIPHVCWIQDAMPHLFDSKIGAALGVFDFVVGMVNSELIEKYGYPEIQTRWMPMVASRAKFGTQSIAEAFDSEIAWVTHQSEHPNVFRDRMIEEMVRNAPDASGKFSKVLEEVESVVSTKPGASVFHEIRQFVDNAFFPAGIPEGAWGLRSNLLQSMVIPYAERVFRHQAAQWAADIATRRGWRFRLYGNGWENHPQLSGFAAGQLEHGDALSACYRHSVVQLHASINQVTHQRVSECLLSGGLPLCRVTREAFGLAQMKFIDQCQRENIGSLVDAPSSAEGPGQKRWRVEIEACDLIKELMNDLHRLDLCDDAELAMGWISWDVERFAKAQEALSNPNEQGNMEMFASIKDLFFTSESQLESLIERAINDRTWRRDRIESARKTLPEALTFDGFVKQVLDLIGSRLGQNK